MKPALIIITIIACLGLTSLFAVGQYQRNIAVDQSSTLAMSVTTEVLMDWDPQAVRRHASDTLLASESAEATQQRYTPMSRRLGALREIYDIQYEVNMPAWWQPDDPARATFSMRARFASETATVRVAMERRQGQWLITGFDIQPPAIAS
jgi:hypothetical protein